MCPLGLSGISHCYDWLTSLHRKQYKRPLAIACFECFPVISRQSIMKSFTYDVMQLQSDLVPLHLSTNVSLWTLKTNYSYQSSDTIWGAIKNKIGYPLVPYAGILLISLQRCKQAVLTKRVKTNVLLLHLTNWQQTQACGLCQKANAHLYTVSSVDEIAAEKRCLCKRLCPVGLLR